MKKGEIWWADLPPPIGRRPVLLLSRNEAYPVRTAVTVAPLTTTIRQIAVEVSLSPADGVPQTCVINCDDLLTIRKSLLQEKIATLAPAKLALVHEAIRFALDMP